MEKQISERFILSFLEWRILFRAGQASSVYFPEEVIRHDDSEEEILSALPGMIRKGILHARQEYFEIASFYQEVLDVVMRADSVLTVYPDESSELIFGVYMSGEKRLLIEFSTIKRQTLILQYLETPEELVEILVTEGYLPEFASVETGGSMSKSDNVTWQEDIQSYFEDPYVKLVIQKIFIPSLSKEIFLYRNGGGCETLWKLTKEKTTGKPDVPVNRERWLHDCMRSRKDDFSGTEGVGLAPML